MRSFGGSTARHGVDQFSGLFHYYSLGSTLLGRTDYTLGYATHFLVANYGVVDT